MLIYMDKLRIVFLVSCLSFLSCTKELDLLFPQTGEQIVLNSILYPDSLIQVSITKTLPISNADDKFPVITNAVVRLYENEQLLGNLTFQDSIYVLDYYPKAGQQYSIEVEVPGYAMLTASDVVPYPLEAEACFAKERYDAAYYAWVRAHIQDRPLEVNYYWLDLLVTGYARLCEFIPGDRTTYHCLGSDTSRTETERPYYMHSYSTIPDKFNASVDNTLGGVTQYETFMRVEDQAIDGEDVELIITAIGGMFQYTAIEKLGSRFATLNIVSASQHYDRYLKSSLIYFLNNGTGEDDDSPNPFAEPTQIYSNVENGTGIFAAYNSVRIKIKHFCE